MAVNSARATSSGTCSQPWSVSRYQPGPAGRSAMVRAAPDLAGCRCAGSRTTGLPWDACPGSSPAWTRSPCPCQHIGGAPGPGTAGRSRHRRPVDAHVGRDGAVLSRAERDDGAADGGAARDADLQPVVAVVHSVLRYASAVSDSRDADLTGRAGSEHRRLDLLALAELPDEPGHDGVSVVVAAVVVDSV